MSEGGALIDDIIEGRYRSLETDRPVDARIELVVIADSLDGREADLLQRVGLTDGLGVVADENTWEVLGRRVADALPAARSIVLDAPHADMEGALRLEEQAHGLAALVTVGSGTLNDLTKAVAARSGQRHAVFATAPSMNGYPTATASLAVEGYKTSVPADPPLGVFVDLEVLTAAPMRMIRAGVGDALCRGTAQTDLLLSHLLLGSVYGETAYDIQLKAEHDLLDGIDGLARREPASVRALIELLILSGLGAVITGSSHVGSMGEHGISHYVDMFIKPHPGSLHGEQVAVATLTMTRLQDEILTSEEPPVLQPFELDEEGMRRRYGSRFEACRAGLLGKLFDEPRRAALNDRLERFWPAFRRGLRSVMLERSRLEAAFDALGVPKTPEAIGLSVAGYAEAVLHAYEIRDRFSMLDLAAHSRRLEPFVRRHYGHSST